MSSSCPLINGVHVCSGPALGGPDGAPPVPEEFGNTSITVHTPLKGPVEIKVVPGSVATPPDSTDLSTYNASDNKKFYFETQQLNLMIRTAADLLPDMAGRVESLQSSEVEEKFAIVSKAISELQNMVTDLYYTTGPIVYASSPPAQPAISGETE